MTNTPKPVQVIGSIFHNHGQLGDFGWMLKQTEFDDAFFIFNDNQEQFLAHRDDPKSEFGCQVGGGNAGIRPYQCHTPPRALGIPTGAGGVGYAALTNEVKQLVDDAVASIRAVVVANNVKRVYYSAADAEGHLGGHIFKTATDVKAYIVTQIRSLRSPVVEEDEMVVDDGEN